MVSNTITPLSATWPLNNLSDAPPVRMALEQILSDANIHTADALREILEDVQQTEDVIEPTQLRAIQALTLYQVELQRTADLIAAAMADQKRSKRSKNSVSPKQKGKAPVRVPHKRPRAKSPLTMDVQSDEEFQDEVVHLDDGEVQENPEDDADDWEDIVERENEEILSWFQKSDKIRDGAEEKRAEQRTMRAIDDDIAEACNSKPFDSFMYDKTMIQELRKIPWIPNFEVTKPPRWPQVIENFAEKVTWVPPKKPYQDFRQYARIKQQAIRRETTKRRRADKASAATQMLYVGQLRLAATMMQKTRNMASIYRSILEQSNMKLSMDQQATLAKAAKGKDDLENLHRKNIRLIKALLNRATRERRNTFVRNCSNKMKNLHSQITKQESVRNEDGTWYIIDPCTLDQEVALTANLEKNMESIAQSQPFRHGRFTGGVYDGHDLQSSYGNSWRGGYQNFRGRGRGGYYGYNNYYGKQQQTPYVVQQPYQQQLSYQQNPNPPANRQS